MKQRNDRENMKKAMDMMLFFLMIKAVFFMMNDFIVSRLCSMK